MEANEVLFSLWATIEETCLDFIDVVRVYLHAKAKKVGVWSFTTRRPGAREVWVIKESHKRGERRCAELEDGVHDDVDGGRVQLRFTWSPCSTATRQTYG